MAFTKYYFKSKQKLLTTQKVDLPFEVGETFSPPQADIIADQFDVLEYLQDALDAGLLTLGTTLLQQEIENQATDTITVTVNSGILPLSDDNIVLYGPTGPLLKGAGSGKYTVNRTVEPNEVVLNDTPFGPINFLLLLWL